MSEAPNAGLKITTLSLADAAKILSKASGRTVTEAVLRHHVALGAPLNPDDTLNLLTYAAWLVRTVAQSE